jgi:hypothetical protein
VTIALTVTEQLVSTQNNYTETLNTRTLKITNKTIIDQAMAGVTEPWKNAKLMAEYSSLDGETPQFFVLYDLTTRDLDGDVEQWYVPIDFGFAIQSAAINGKKENDPVANVVNNSLKITADCDVDLANTFSGHGQAITQTTRNKSEKAAAAEWADPIVKVNFTETQKITVAGLWDGNPCAGTIGWSIKTITYDNRD